MKTTFDLPDILLREIERRAVQKQQALNEAVTELLRQGLTATKEQANSLRPLVLKRHAVTGLPYLECPQAACVEEEMTPERVADLLLEQEPAWSHEAR